MYKLNTSILLDHLTWPQVEKKINEGYKNILLGVGSTEQHGPHLPLFTDAFCGDVIGNAVSENIGKTLQAPTIRVGCSSAHLGFPGTMSISAQTLKKLILEYGESLSLTPFKNFIIVPTHGGNFKPILDLLEETGGKINKLKLIAYTDFEELMVRFHEASQKFKISREDAGLHAGEIETSIMLYLSKEFIQGKTFEKGTLNFSTVEEVYKKGTRSLSKNGILGNPKTATAEKGKVYLQCYVDAVTQYLKKNL
ncbi:MAG: creatininase family protein [Deltaproteobacteria bacterium]|nr:creatininase family protein [Deltaproteobacteria bacterium]